MLRFYWIRTFGFGPHILHWSTLQVCFNPTALWSTTVPRQKQQSRAHFPDNCCCAFIGPVDITGNLDPICLRHWPTFQVLFTPAARWDSWIHKKCCKSIPRPLSREHLQRSQWIRGCIAEFGPYIRVFIGPHFNLGLGHVKRDLPEIGSIPLLYCGVHRFLVRLTYYLLFPFVSFFHFSSLLVPQMDFPRSGLS